MALFRGISEYWFLLTRWLRIVFLQLTVAERRRCEADIVRDYNKKFYPEEKHV